MCHYELMNEYTFGSFLEVPSAYLGDQLPGLIQDFLILNGQFNFKEVKLQECRVWPHIMVPQHPGVSWTHSLIPAHYLTWLILPFLPMYSQLPPFPCPHLSVSDFMKCLFTALSLKTHCPLLYHLADSKAPLCSPAPSESLSVTNRQGTMARCGLHWSRALISPENPWISLVGVLSCFPLLLSRPALLPLLVLFLSQSLYSQCHLASCCIGKRAPWQFPLYPLLINHRSFLTAFAGSLIHCQIQWISHFLFY